MSIQDPYQNSARRSGMRAIFLILLLLVLSLWLLAGCSAPRSATNQSAREERTATEGSASSAAAPELAADSLLFAADAFSDDSAVAAVRHLETYPFDSAAPDLRRRLFAWLVVSPRLQDFPSSTTIIDQWVQTSSFPGKEELMTQYLFGSAALVITSANRPEPADQQEAGLRSMITTYRNMARARPPARDTFLDELDDMRRKGELKGFILRQNEMGRSR